MGEARPIKTTMPIIPAAEGALSNRSQLASIVHPEALNKPNDGLRFAPPTPLKPTGHKKDVGHSGKYP